LGTGYTRQSAADIQDGEDIIAGPLNTEFNQLESAFNATTGHSHDGTTGEGPLIDLTLAVTDILPVANGGTGLAAITDLLAIEALAGTSGGLFKTAANTWALRDITGTASQITVTNGSGAAGAPTLSLPADVLIPTVLTVPNSGLHILDTNASHDLIITPGSDLTADRILTITTGDAARTIIMSGSPTLDNWFDQSVKTTANPQFATIELGAATDTTISRVSAGVIAVEGSNVLLASGLGSITQAYDADLAALAANSTDGFWAHTGAGTGAARTVTGTANQIGITNGNGVSGDPVWSLASTLIVPGTLQITGASVLPVTSDGTVLGSGTKMFSDLFLASGGVINFNNGDITIVHTAGILSLNGELKVTTAGSGATSVVTTAGSQQLSNKNFSDNVDALSFSTISDMSVTGVTSGLQIDSAGRINISNTGSAATRRVAFYNTNGEVGTIQTSGSATSYNTSSDQFFKTNFTDFDAGEIIDRLNLYHFDWKTGGDGYGVKAQEAYTVFPHAVSVGSAPELLGTDEYEKWSVDYSKFVPLLLKEVQNLRRRLNELEA
jgi:hypothetical protein